MSLILLVFSFVCFVLSFFQIGSPNWNKLISAGLAFWVAVQIFGGVVALTH